MYVTKRPKRGRIGKKRGRIGQPFRSAVGAVRQDYGRVQPLIPPLTTAELTTGHNQSLRPKTQTSPAANRLRTNRPTHVADCGDKATRSRP